MGKPTLGPWPLDYATKFDALATTVGVGGVTSRSNGVAIGVDVKMDIDGLEDWVGIEDRKSDGVRQRGGIGGCIAKLPMPFDHAQGPTVVLYLTMAMQKSVNTLPTDHYY